MQFQSYQLQNMEFEYDQNEPVHFQKTVKYVHIKRYMDDEDRRPVIKQANTKRVAFSMLKSAPQPLPRAIITYEHRLTPEQIAILEAEFRKNKTLHDTDLSLLAFEMGASERDVQAWYHLRVGAWRREQGLSDTFGQV